MKQPFKIATNLLVALCFSAALPSFAEVIEIPVGAQVSENISIELPRTGMQSDNVKQVFGVPEIATPAVGHPPISRWEYADYYVYFEYDHVIHSVIKHKPQNFSH